MSSTPTTRSRTRRGLAATGAVALLAAGAAAWIGSGASADPIQTDVAATCTILGGNQDVTVPVTYDDAVDPIAPGAEETLTIRQQMPQLPVEVTVNSLSVTTPIPAEVTPIDVTFQGGNIPAQGSIDGGTLDVTFTGPMSASQIQFPDVILRSTVATDPGTDTIRWKVWSRMVTDTNFGTADCTPKDPNQDLNTTTITGPAVTTPPATDPGTSPSTPGAGDLPGLPGTTPPAATPPVTPPPSTTPPAATPPPTGASNGPVASVCVEVNVASSGAGCPAPATGDGTSGSAAPTSPLPLPVPLPLPLPSGGLPLPAPGGTGTLLDLDAVVNLG